MWYYKNEPYDEIGEYVGFVYQITNTLTNKKYIGKKNFYFSNEMVLKCHQLFREICNYR